MLFYHVYANIRLSNNKNEKEAKTNMSPESNIELASWNRPRSTEQLLDFISRREAEIADVEE